MRQRHFRVTSCSPPAVGCHMFCTGKSAAAQRIRWWSGTAMVVRMFCRTQCSSGFEINLLWRLQHVLPKYESAFFLMSRYGFLFAWCACSLLLLILWQNEWTSWSIRVAALKTFRSSLFCLQCSRPRATSFTCCESRSNTKLRTLYFSTERLHSHDWTFASPLTFYFPVYPSDENVMELK